METSENLDLASDATATSTAAAGTTGTGTNAPAPAAAGTTGISTAPAPAAVGDGAAAMLKQIESQMKAAAQQAFDDFKAKLPDLTLSAAEQDDVKWSLTKLLGVGAAAIGVSTADAKRLEQDRLDALSCLRDIEAIKAHDGEKVLLQTAAAVFAKAQDVILGLAPVLIAKL